MHYNHHAQSTSPKKRLLKRSLLVSLLLGVILLLLFVWLDSRKSTAVDDSKNLGQSYDISKTQEVKKEFDEILYKFTLPADWELLKRNENKLFNTNEYHSTKQFEDGKRMTVYVDTIPEENPLNILQPVEAVGPKMTLRTPSARCEEFTKGTESKVQGGRAIDQVKAKWDSIDFFCETSTYRHVVGIGEPKSGKLGVTLLSGDGKTTRRIFILYYDATGKPNDQILQEAVTSFTLK
jgi:hypothetical protein